MCPKFSGYQQHDSQEFLATLLDLLHEDLNRKTKGKYVEETFPDTDEFEFLSAKSWNYYLSKNQSIIVDVFQGQYKTTISCLTCKKVSYKFDTFMYLSLPIDTNKANSDIIECIKLFSQEEILKGENEFYCSKCRKFSEARFKHEIYQLPPILIIHLLRFKYFLNKHRVHSNGRKEKINTTVTYPIHALDFSGLFELSKKVNLFISFRLSTHHMIYLLLVYTLGV